MDRTERGKLAVVEAWLGAVERVDGPRLVQLSADDIEIVGPRGSARGHRVLEEWLGRAGFSARSTRWFCGADDAVVVEGEARWTDGSDAEVGRAVVASRFTVRDGRVARYARHDELRPALAVAGLTEADEVTGHDVR